MSDIYRDMVASLNRIERVLSAKAQASQKVQKALNPIQKLAALDSLRKRAKAGEDVSKELKELMEPHDYGKDLSNNATYYDKNHDGELDPQKAAPKSKEATRSRKANPAHNYGPNLDDMDVYYDKDHDGKLDQPFEHHQASPKRKRAQ